MSSTDWNGWHEVRLGDVCEYITVGHVGSMADQYVADGIPFLRSQNVRPFSLNMESIKFIEPEFHQKLKKSALRPGDVVVVRTGYPGTATVIPDWLPISNCADLVIIRPSEQLNPKFLSALFNSVWGQGVVAGSLVGVAQQHFNVTVAREMKIPFPPIDEQRQIADILSAYDDLIENNTRRIQILEEMARTIYREWFVHFRYPGHTSTPLVDSPIGPAPEGWEVVHFSDAVQVRPSVKVPRDGIKPYIPMGSLSTDSMVIHPIEERSGNSGAKFQNGDTLMARITPSLENGKTGYVQFLPTDDAVAFGSTEFIVLRSKKLCPEMVYLLARTEEVRSHAIKSMTGASGRQRVQESCFDDLLLAAPPADLIKQFQQLVKPVVEAIHRHNERNLVLTRVRDLLLPRLISGQIDMASALAIPVEVGA